MLTLVSLHTGANVQKGIYMESPLHAAAEKDCIAIVKLLLDFGADINARNLEFQRPVEAAPPSSLTEGFLLVYEGKFYSFIQSSFEIRKFLYPKSRSVFASFPKSN